MLDIIQKALEEVTLARIDGSTAEKHRQSIVDDFNSGNSVIEAMLLSTKAAGVGKF
jgi:SNF2 family DNA or RNA helicase